MAKEEKLLSEGTLDEGTPQTNPFSLADWIHGIGQMTRSIRIYGDLDAYGDREQAGEDLQVARARNDGEMVQELKQRINELTVAMQESAVDFKLRELTQSKRVEVIEQIESLGVDDEVERTMHALAHYVYEPVGVTADMLLELAERSPLQANALVGAMNQLNTSVPNVEARPF